MKSIRIRNSPFPSPKPRNQPKPSVGLKLQLPLEDWLTFFEQGISHVSSPQISSAPIHQLRSNTLRSPSCGQAASSANFSGAHSAKSFFREGGEKLYKKVKAPSQGLTQKTSDCGCSLAFFYGGHRFFVESMAGTTGLEPATSAVTGRRSNQLSYVPTLIKRLVCFVQRSQPLN